MSMFKKATKSQSKLRLALAGVSGAGKTMTALRIARALGRRIAVLDTERGSASKYAGERIEGDLLEFDVLELEAFAPAEYVKGIRAAEVEGYDVLVIDSLTHAWAGKGGALEMVDDAVARSKSGNSYMAWRDVTPEHNALVEAMLRSRCHIIGTMRAKAEYVMQEEKGKLVPKKIGMAPIQRDGMEYEFDVFADIDLEHKLMVSKTRCAALDKKVFRNPGPEIAEILKAWLSDGAPVVREADKLIDELARCREEETFAALRERANKQRLQMTPAERTLVKEAVDAARALLDRVRADRAEAEAVEATIRAEQEQVEARKRAAEANGMTTMNGASQTDEDKEAALRAQEAAEQGELAQSQGAPS